MIEQSGTLTTLTTQEEDRTIYTVHTITVLFLYFFGMRVSYNEDLSLIPVLKNKNVNKIHRYA